MSYFWQPTAKGRRRSWTDPTAECGGVNPPNQEWSPEGGQLPVFTHCSGSSCSRAGAKRIDLHSFGLQGEAERGILTTGHPRISIHSAQACALERSLQCRCSSDNTTRETAVTSYKPRMDWRKLGCYGLSPTVGGIIVSHWSANATLSWAAPSQ